jgi:hypothetical protein
VPVVGALATVPPVLELATAVAALVSTTPELDGAQGDLLVTDARARLPFSASHTTNPLNHAEALWDPTLQAQVVAILSRLRTIASPGPLATAKIFPYPASPLPAWHFVLGFNTATGAPITPTGVRLVDATGITVLSVPGPGPFLYGRLFTPVPIAAVLADLPAPFGTVVVDIG